MVPNVLIFENVLFSFFRESPDGVKQLKDSIVIYEQRIVNDGEKIKMLEKENEELKNNLDVNSFLLPPIEESKLGKNKYKPQKIQV